FFKLGADAGDVRAERARGGAQMDVDHHAGGGLDDLGLADVGHDVVAFFGGDGHDVLAGGDGLAGEAVDGDDGAGDGGFDVLGENFLLELLDLQLKIGGGELEGHGIGGAVFGGVIALGGGGGQRGGGSAAGFGMGGNR